jgi:hypothetical protein
LGSGIAFLSRQKNYRQKQRRHIDGMLCGKDKFETLTDQQLFIFPLNVAAQCRKISSGIAYFSSRGKIWKKTKTTYLRKAVRQNKFIFPLTVAAHASQRSRDLFLYEFNLLPALQRNFDLCIPRKGIARPQSQFPHSCVCERPI